MGDLRYMLGGDNFCGVPVSTILLQAKGQGYSGGKIRFTEQELINHVMGQGLARDFLLEDDDSSEVVVQGAAAAVSSSSAGDAGF